MPDIIVRPSVKLIKLTYWLSLLLAAVIFAASFVENAPRGIIWALLLPGVMLVCAAFAHMSRMFTKLTVGAERLRYESGMLSKSTRAMELGKVQNVNVDQSLTQRMLGLGNLSIETAGESSRLTIANIDRPNEVAEKILAAAQGAAKGRQQ